MASMVDFTFDEYMQGLYDQVKRDKRGVLITTGHLGNWELLVQTFAVVFDVSLADLLAKFGITVTSNMPFAELLNVTLPRIGALLPFLLMVLILVFRPRGLLGTRDT